MQKQTPVGQRATGRRSVASGPRQPAPGRRCAGPQASCEPAPRPGENP
ncbi:hypothetical protein [Pantoea agglomerans]|nr:hypothetical protein [Pantoea agglomerans]MBD8224670.1 hypothetical protein [Pantoea agglomerans]